MSAKYLLEIIRGVILPRNCDTASATDVDLCPLSVSKATDCVAAKPLVEDDDLKAVELEELAALGFLGSFVGVAGILRFVIGSPVDGVSAQQIRRGVADIFAVSRGVHDTVHSGS